MSMQRFGMHMTMNAPLSMPSKLKNCPLTNLAVNNSKEYGLFGKQIYDKKIVNSSFIKRRCC